MPEDQSTDAARRRDTHEEARIRRQVEAETSEHDHAGQDHAEALARLLNAGGWSPQSFVKDFLHWYYVQQRETWDLAVCDVKAYIEGWYEGNDAK